MPTYAGEQLLAVPISGLQQTLDSLHYRSLLRYRLFMRMCPEQATCTACQDPMDIFGDHTLLCSRQPASAGLQLRHRLVQQAPVTLWSLPTCACHVRRPLPLVAGQGFQCPLTSSSVCGEVTTTVALIWWVCPSPAMGGKTLHMYCQL